MRKIFLAMTSVLFAFACGCSADIEGERFQQSAEAVQAAKSGHVDAKGLKAIMDAGVPYVLLDARGNKWHDNSRIPEAKMVSYETSAEEVAALVPHADSLVIVYCYSFKCPLGRMLVANLIDFGYGNVIEYPGGLSEWRDIAGYSVVQIAD